MLPGKHPADHRCKELFTVVGENVALRIEGVEVGISGAGISIGYHLIFTALDTLENDRGLIDDLVVFGVVGERESVTLGVALCDYVYILDIDKIGISFLIKLCGLINERAGIVRLYRFLVVTEIDFYRSFLCDSLGKDGVGRTGKGLRLALCGREIQTKEGSKDIEDYVEHENDRYDRESERGGEHALLTDYRALYYALGGGCRSHRFPFVVDL